jgi:hypothetical protein
MQTFMSFSFNPQLQIIYEFKSIVDYKKNNWVDHELVSVLYESQHKESDLFVWIEREIKRIIAVYKLNLAYFAITKKRHMTSDEFERKDREI